MGINDGEKADLVVFDYIPQTEFNEDTLLGHYIYGITESRAQYVIKSDKILLDNYELTMNPYQDYIDNAQKITEELFKRFINNKSRYRSINYE